MNEFSRPMLSVSQIKMLAALVTSIGLLSPGFASEHAAGSNSAELGALMKAVFPKWAQKHPVVIAVPDDTPAHKEITVSVTPVLVATLSEKNAVREKCCPSRLGRASR